MAGKSRIVLGIVIACAVFAASAAFAESRFATLMEQVRTAPLPAMTRLTDNRERYIDDLEVSGVLDEQGLTRGQAGDLYDVLAERLGVTLRADRASPVPTSEERPYPRSAKAAPAGPIVLRAEFDQQIEMLMRWPIGFGAYLPTYYGLAEHVGDTQPVTIIVAGDAQENTARAALTGQGISLDNIAFAHWPTDTVWTRDYGPVFVGLGDAAPREEAIVDMSYSRPWRAADDTIPDKAGLLYGADVYETDFVEDGGNLLTDGRGTCFATRYLFDNNPGWTQGDVEQWFAEYLGCEQVILPEPILNEGTGHIDMFVKVIDPHTVMVGEVPESDPNHDRLDDAAELIASSSALDGDPYTVIRLPQRTDYGIPVLPVFYTYTNGLLVNGKTLVPQYFLDTDDDALAVYVAALPDREAIPIDAANIIESGGALHCITMERQDYATDPADDDDDADDDVTDDDAGDDDDDDWHDDDAADDDAGDDDDVGNGNGDGNGDDGDDDDDGGCGC